MYQKFNENFIFYKFNLQVESKVRLINYGIYFAYISLIVSFALYVRLSGKANISESGVSSLVIKVKGADLTEGSIWDAVDYVYPPQEVKAFLITTKASITKQFQGKCPDNDGKSRCSSDKNCINNTITENGVQNGSCDIKSKMCFISAWCPVENEKSTATKQSFLRHAQSFTVYIRNHEEFLKLGKSRSNDLHSNRYSSKCLYNRTHDPNCPIFKISDILNEINVKFQDVNQKGGLFLMFIRWNCNFDGDSNKCNPEYSFKHIAKGNDGNYTGYEMKYALYQDNNGSRQRDLITVNGLRFLIVIKSVGEMFSFSIFFQAFGSYFSYLTIVTVIATFIVNCVYSKNYVLTESEHMKLKPCVSPKKNGDAKLMADLGDKDDQTNC